MSTEQQQVVELGRRVFPLNGKKPLKGYRWKEQAASELVSTESYGIACDDKITVLDADTRDFAVWWYKNRPRTEWMVKTPRGGVHFYYSGHYRNRQFDEFDVRGDGGYVVGPGSIVNGVRYELVRNCRITLDLPEFEEAWLPEPKAEPKEGYEEPDFIRRVTRARAYLATVEPAISGQCGHSKTMYAASSLIQKFRLSIDQAFPLLLEWNEKCEPPWSHKDLLRKLQEAERLQC